VLEVFSFIAFTVANTYTQSQVDGLLADYAGLRLLVPTSATNGTVGASGAVTFSGVGSVSINGVFNSTYSNYRIVTRWSSSVNGNNLGLKMRSGTTDTTGSDYYGNDFQMGLASSTLTGGNTNANTSLYCGQAETITFGHVMDIFNPFETTRTSVTGSTYANALWINFGGQHALTNSYDGITFLNRSSGTLSGTIRVYGYKN
jgi:hypothetical protein